MPTKTLLDNPSEFPPPVYRRENSGNVVHYDGFRERWCERDTQHRVAEWHIHLPDDAVKLIMPKDRDDAQLAAVEKQREVDTLTEKNLSQAETIKNLVDRSFPAVDLDAVDQKRFVATYLPAWAANLGSTFNLSSESVNWIVNTLSDQADVIEKIERERQEREASFKEDVEAVAEAQFRVINGDTDGRVWDSTPPAERVYYYDRAETAVLALRHLDTLRNKKNQ